MKHGTKYITVDLFQNIFISEAEQMHPCFPFYYTRDKSTYSPFQNPKLVRCVIQRGLIVMCLSMAPVMLSCYHVQSLHMPGMWSFSYAVKTLFDTSVRTNSNWM